MKKLKALAERGERSEATTAAELLQKLMKKYGVTEQDLDDQKRSRCELRYSKPYERELLMQIVYMVMGDVPVRRYTNSRAKVLLVDCTAAEKIEIEADFDFYRHHLAEGFLNYYRAFVQREELFPDPSKKQADIPAREVSKEELRLTMALEKHERHLAITDGKS